MPLSSFTEDYRDKYLCPAVVHSNLSFSTELSTPNIGRCQHAGKSIFAGALSSNQNSLSIQNPIAVSLNIALLFSTTETITSPNLALCKVETKQAYHTLPTTAEHCQSIVLVLSS